MKKRLLLTLSLATLCSIAQTDARRLTKAPTWQWSEKASVLLAVRDKYAELGSYEATFTVTTPLSETFHKSITVSGDDWGDVRFPDDFDLPSSYPTKQRAGRFKWVCMVKGKVVTSGQFEIATTFDFESRFKGKGAKP